MNARTVTLPRRHLSVLKSPGLIAVAAAMFAVWPAFAQPAASPETATFRLISTVGSHQDLKYEPAPGRPPVPVSLNQNVSRPYPCPVNGTLDLFRELPPPADSPPGTPPVRESVLKVRLPKAALNCLVVTAPKNGDTSSPFLGGRAYPDNPEEHGPGRLLVINLSSHNLAVLIDRDHHIFRSGTNSMASLPQKTGRMLFRIAASSDESTWKFVYKGERRLSPYHRGYLIFTDFINDPDYTPEAFPPPVRSQLFFEFAPTAVSEFQKSGQH